jgi:hypothetical protein
MTAPADDLRDAVAGFVRGRPFVLVGRPLAQYGRLVAALRRLGAAPPLVLANGLGAGAPPEGIADYLLIDLGNGGGVETARATDRFLRSPSAAACQAVGTYDPSGSALVLAESIINCDRFAGRWIADGRPAAWAALEDPRTSASILGLSGTAGPPALVVGGERNALAAAHDRADLGAGTLWIGDGAGGPRHLWDQVRIVRSAADAAEAAEALGECERVKVVPNVAGAPAAISGVVLPDGVAILPAVEEIVLVGPERTRLRHAGASTYFVPGAAVAPMRSAVRNVGNILAAEHGFRGAFVLSGIVRADRFFPLDLAARLSAPHVAMSAAMAELPWALIQAAVVSGRDLGVSAPDFEAVVAAGVRAAPWSLATLDLPRTPGAESETCWLAAGDAGLRPAAPGHASIGFLLRDQSAARSVVSVMASPHQVPGPRNMAAFASEAFALSDRLWDTGFGPLTPLAG